MKSLIILVLIPMLFILTNCSVNKSLYQGLDENIIYAINDTVISDVIIYHRVRLNQDGNILPWYSSDLGKSYAHVLDRVWHFWKTMEADYNGMQYYMNHQIWDPDHDNKGIGGDQIAMALSSWDLYYIFTGDESIVENMRYMADYYLANSLSPENSQWPNLPYPYNMDVESGIYDGDMILGKGYLQPDKAGSLGIELVKLYKRTGERKYLDAAVQMANTLAEKVQPGDNDHSPWPFKVHAETGETGLILLDQEMWYEGMDKDLEKTTSKTLRSTYTTNWTGTLELFASLIELGEGNPESYKKAFDIALNWMITYPAKTNKWGPFFEDIPRWSDTQINAITYAMFLMENPDLDRGWEETVKNIFRWVHNELDNHRYSKYGVITIDEQTAYRQPGNSHSSRQASMELRYWELTGDTIYVRNAVRMLNWATYMVDHDGKNFYPTNAIWMTDGYGDYTRHYLRAMAAAPQLAPEDGDHLLRTNSVVRHITYEPGRISYNTYDEFSEELFRLTFKPGKITVNGKELKDTGNADIEGWSWQPMMKGGILKINNQSGNQITIVE